MLVSCYSFYRPQIYLFEGPQGGKYSVKSIHDIFKRVCEKAGIIKLTDRSYIETQLMRIKLNYYCKEDNIF